MTNENVKTETSELIHNTLKHRARALSVLPEAALETDESLHLVTFSLREEKYAVEVNYIQEVQPLGEGSWAKVPGAPDFIVGVINIRGRIYSVMDAGQFLGLPPRQLSERTHVLLVNSINEPESTMELCIITDDVPQVSIIPVEEIQSSAMTISPQAQAYVQGVTKDMHIILDMDYLLSDPSIVVQEEVQ